MKEKINDYIELLEAKARQCDEYYKERLELYVSNQEKNKKLEAYENMRKEAIEYIEHAKFIREQVILKRSYELQDFQVRKLLTILNKVGESDDSR